MGFTGQSERRGASGPGNGRAMRSDTGFTLVEMTTSVAVLLIVLTAAWLLLTVSNSNLNKIDYGGQASEMNRAALASFERDLGHGMLPGPDESAVSVAATRSCSFLADVDKDRVAETVTWAADDVNHRLLRIVTTEAGVTTTQTVLSGLATSDSLGNGSQMFSYAIDATRPDWQHDPSKIGLITFRLRNGMPDPDSNIVDRTAVFRVIAYVINGSPAS
jgi:prepilin-type N-terminal cleavage/methylation domain-containing protein